MGILKKFSLKGKLALVTRGAGLYGKCITEGLAEAGATVYLASRTLTHCQQVAKALTEQGYQVLAGELDLAETKSIKRLYQRILKEKGKMDILLNNAVLRPMKTYQDPIENFELSMKVNATGLVNLTRIFSQNMMERKSGIIINISSMQGTVGPDFTLYEGTGMDALPDYFFHKAGLINLTRYLASKLGPYNIRVNCVSPGGLFNNQDPKFV